MELQQSILNFMVCLFKDLLGGFSSYMKTKLPKYCCRLVCVLSIRKYLTKNIEPRNFVLVGEKSVMFIGEDFLVPVVTI